MKIKNIRLSGFDKLYDGYELCRQEHRQGFGSGLFTFLNHLMVSYEIEDFSGIELFYLKKFCSEVKIIDHTYGNFMDNSAEARDTYNVIESILEIHDSLVKDSDIDKSVNSIDNILPLGCHQYHVIAIFKGAKITALTGAMIQNLFIGPDGAFFPAYVGNYLMENKLAQLFYNEFYTFISNEMTDIDIVTEFVMDKSYYKFANTACSLAHVNSPYGELVFYNNSPQNLSKQIEVVKDTMATSPYSLEDNIYLTFCCRTTFHTFMELFLSTGYVIDHENLKLTFRETHVSIDSDVIDKYKTRINNSINRLNAYKFKLAESSDINLTKFNFIFGGNLVTYSLQIPSSDVFDGKVDRLFGESANHEISNIRNEIRKSSQIVSSIFR